MKRLLDIFVFLCVFIICLIAGTMIGLPLGATILIAVTVTLIAALFIEVTYE